MQVMSQIFPNIFNTWGVDFLDRSLHNGDMGTNSNAHRPCFSRISLFRNLAVCQIFLGLSALAASPLLIGESIGEVQDRPLAPRPGHFQVGLNMASNLPMNRPFVSGTTSDQDFQFQVSRATGIEFEMGWSQHLSFAISGAWESFDTRLDTGSGVNTEFQNASVSTIPVMFAAKYRFRDSGWTPEVELGAGMGLYRFTLTSSNESSTKDSSSSASFIAHGLLGARFFWNEDWSLSFHVGYRYTGVGTQHLDNGIREVSTDSFTGLISRGGIAYRF
jgi:hypothetical protein